MLNHVYWIGGSSGGAKSTVARYIASQIGASVYCIDNMVGCHRTRYTPEECPKFHAFVRMSMDERWADRTPQEMHDSFHWFHGEGFQFIIEDILSLPSKKPILVEGYHLLPSLLEPYMASINHAVWLISTPDFRRQAFTERGSLWTIPNKTSKPEIALSNHLERERIFAERLVKEVDKYGLRHILVDGGQTEEELAALVFQHLRLSISIAPDPTLKDENRV